MNQNYENGEMEILESNGIRSGFSMGNIQNSNISNMSNMRYEEWQDMCGTKKEGELFSYATGTQAASDITWAILHIGNPAFSEAGGIHRTISPILWPTETQDPQAVWSSLIDRGEYLLQKPIDATLKSQVIAEINGFETLFNRYNDFLNILKQNPGDTGLQEAVRLAFNYINSQLLERIPKFSATNYEVQLLPVYTQITNLHLLLLRDAAKFGKSWGMSDADINTHQSSLTTQTRIYTDYCVRTYNTGLSNTPAPNLNDCTRYPWLRYDHPDITGPVPANPCTGRESSCDDEQGNENLPEVSPRAWYRSAKEEYAGTETWNLYNDFRREMTIMVLDLIALWPTYNPLTYNIPVKQELTRELYTSILGTTYQTDHSQNTISAIDNRMTRRPHLFEWLTGDLTVDVRQMNANWIRGYFQTKVKQRTKRTLGSTITVHESGKQGSDYHYFPNVTANERDFRAFDTNVWFEPRLFRMYFADKWYYPSWDVNVLETEPWSPEGPKTHAYQPTIRSSINRHRVSFWMWQSVRSNAPFTRWNEGQLSALNWAWTHDSADPNNTLAADKITRIPAVKAFQIKQGAQVIKGPGFTGGDVITMPSSSHGAKTQIEMNVKPQQTGKPYRVRVRYASQQSGEIFVGKWVEKWFEKGWYSIPATYSGELTQSSFRYLDTIQFTANESQFGIDLQAGIGGAVIIDTVEFIPLNTTLEEYEVNQKLERARKVVNTLFTDNANQRLKGKVLGSDLDIAMGLIEDIPSDRFQKERMILRDRIKQAKRLSQSRNLLRYGDFESPDWSGENGWTISNGVSVESTNSVLKGNYLNLPNARDPLSDGTIYPSYVYQKVDESKLKPYTRYWIRGLIGSSQDLELIVSRYRKEVHKTLNVLDNLDLTSLQNRFESLNGPQILEQVRENLQGMSCGPYSSLLQTTGNTGEDPHIFSCHIDVGELDLGCNPGIEVALKINTVDGGAQIRHIELIEGAPLTSEEIARVKRQEKKWKQKRTQIFTRDQGAIQTAQEAINRLFVSPTCGRLKLTTTLQDIAYAQTLVNAIPDRYNQIVSELPGVNMDIFGRLQNQLEMAYGLYNTRNVVVDGDFMSGLANWNATEGAEMQQIDGTSV
ncbi:insecticidal delta-endotoxin Cry8Ea1 family protein, partial [Bacillus pacificus]|nr:insecticidal delta-endotoxin Cry8Ea1 family protein [Bacillus pacificus]